jgi:Domain of unknown function (DUF4157)/Lysine-specific metallo-endopeptidase
VVVVRRTRSQKESDTAAPPAPASRTATPEGAQPLLELQALAGNEVINRLADRYLPVDVGAAGGPVTPATEAAIAATTGAGSPLPSGVRRAMETAFGADFGAVRLHAGPEAAELNQRLQSHAFTIGPDIFFRAGEPDTTTANGQGLLAHELAHTIQQGAAVPAASAGQPALRRRFSATGPLRGAQAKLVVGATSDPAEEEAEQVARRVVAALQSPATAARSDGTADPLAAELLRSDPTSSGQPGGRRSSIQRADVPLGEVGLADEKAPPTYTAVTRDQGTQLNPAMQQKLTDAIVLARTRIPTALANADKIEPQTAKDLPVLDEYFKLSKDPGLIAKEAAAAAAEALHKEKEAEAAAAAGPEKANAEKARDKAATAWDKKKEHRDTHATSLRTNTKTKLQTVLGKVADGLAKSQSIKDVNPNTTDVRELGYVHPFTRFGLRPGDIHLRFSMLSKSPAERVGIILVHEATHKFAGTDDNAYRGGSRWAGMTHAQALKNADSYSEYVKDFGQ